MLRVEETGEFNNEGGRDRCNIWTGALISDDVITSELSDAITNNITQAKVKTLKRRSVMKSKMKKTNKYQK